MAIPLFVAGAAGLAGLLGHKSAKKKTEMARIIAQEAQDLYNGAKTSLESAQEETKSAMLVLGKTKQRALDGSVQQFLIAYERIKDIEFRNSAGLNEISKFAIDDKAVSQLRKLSNEYQSSIKSGAAGAAAGMAISLAAGGSLGVLSAAGTALVLGEVGMATSLAGSALSYAAATTPLAFIAAPAVLFAGISASMKASENLEKAEEILAEAELAVEKMETSKTLCRAIAERSAMFNDLLVKLDGMFSECAYILDTVTSSKAKLFNRQQVGRATLTPEVLKLAAVTRSLAGAVKAVIDTPILNKNGELSSESERVYRECNEQLPSLSSKASEVEALNYHIKIKPRKIKAGGSSNKARDILSIIIGAIAAVCMYKFAISKQCPPFVSATLSLLAFTIATISYVYHYTKNLFFKVIKNACRFTVSVEFCIVLYFACKYWIRLKYFWWINIPLFILSFVLLRYLMKSAASGFNIWARKITFCAFSLPIAIIMFLILSKWIGISFAISIVSTEILYGLAAFFCFWF